MNRKAWLHVVMESRNGYDALFVKAVTSNFEEHFYKPILKSVYTGNLSKQAYSFTLKAFWESFVRNEEELPESNIYGSIAQYSRQTLVKITIALLKGRNSVEFLAKYGFYTTKVSNWHLTEYYCTDFNR